MKRRMHAAGICDCCDPPKQRELFDVSRTTTARCVVCHADRQPEQEKAAGCDYDFKPELFDHRRPKDCLNAIRPEHQDIPY